MPLCLYSITSNFLLRLLFFQCFHSFGWHKYAFEIEIVCRCFFSFHTPRVDGFPLIRRQEDTKYFKLTWKCFFFTAFDAILGIFTSLCAKSKTHSITLLRTLNSRFLLEKATQFTKLHRMRKKSDKIKRRKQLIFSCMVAACTSTMCLDLSEKKSFSCLSNK